MKQAGFCIIAFMLLGCQQSTQPQSKMFADAKHAGNISTIYEIGPHNDPPPATDFAWLDSTGKVHWLSEYKGRTVVLNIWASWCSNCITEMPGLQNIAQNGGDSIVVIGISNDNQRSNTFETIQAFTKAYKITYQVVIDSMLLLTSDYIAASNGLYSIPETFIIGKDGAIKFLLPGDHPEATIKSYIDKAN